MGWHNARTLDAIGMADALGRGALLSARQAASGSAGCQFWFNRECVLDKLICCVFPEGGRVDVFRLYGT